ncbi:uncharacterized protein DUF3429 [Aquabacterium commune]|uniref:Uncharacterized protein DUF3429 n=1 Tax=Aquabacterium commune TaxID=70586 RepID=A0A4R6REQ8_9BURK|nr:DUF3429 domain-containing protein [Aquabacterium commune]TDP84692.1 uncharacterized protein DUF3429 [Aquabacterium commune]
MLADAPAPNPKAPMTAHHAVPAAAHHPEPSELALRLGYAGLIPFAAGAVFVWLLVGRIDDEPFAFVVRALASYGALIVSFLGGMRWGLVMGSSEAGALSPGYQRRALWTGIAFSLAAWLALLMPPHAGLVVMGALLIACYLLDRKHYLELGVSGWLTLRFRLTVVASLSCFLAAAQI